MHSTLKHYLHSAKRGIKAVPGEKVRVGTDLGDTLVGDDGDAVRVLDGR